MENQNEKYIKIGEIEIRKNCKLRVMIGIRIFIGEVTEITEYNDIIIIDVKGNKLAFKPKNTKFIQLLTEEEYERIISTYTNKK